MPHVRMQAAACTMPGVDTAGGGLRIFTRPTVASLIAHYSTHNVARKKNIHTDPETFQNAFFKLIFLTMTIKDGSGRNCEVTRGENKHE